MTTKPKCPDCSNAMEFTGESGSSYFFECHDGCKVRWIFTSIPWHHQQSALLTECFGRLARFGRRDGEDWPLGMLPILYPCGCCCQWKVGFWTPEATAGFYICKAWESKRPTVLGALKAHKGHDGTGSDFICDECAQHSELYKDALARAE